MLALCLPRINETIPVQTKPLRTTLLCGLSLLFTQPIALLAADQPQWGQRYSRNQVSDETGLPARFDPETGENIRWSVPLGTETNSTPVVAHGRVLIGTNNGQPRDPRHQGDRGILFCLEESTGRLCWQLVVPQFENTDYLDWRTGGICSPPTVEGDRVYVVSNRAEVMCLDLHGQSNGNDGPFLDEGRLMARAGEPPLDVTEIDADILWSFDMPAEIGIHPHDAAHSSILIHGPYLYLNTGNGVNKTHTGIPSPDAPSLIVLDKATGRLVAQDEERIGPRIFHCTWSSPALGIVDGQPRIFFCGGDGVCYGFQALAPGQDTREVLPLKRVWRFDCDPTAPKENVHDYMRNRKVSPSNIKGMPVFHQGRLYVAVGGDIWWGKREAYLMCIDATSTGDVTQTALIWKQPLDQHCCSTPAIAGDLAFIADCGRNIYCLDAQTGEPCWTQATKGEVFGSTLVADGKVYLGTKYGKLWVFAADREKRLLANIDLGSRMNATPVAANGVLYLATMERLFAVGTP
jgi:outer membrane protein assembly factor BamB